MNNDYKNDQNNDQNQSGQAPQDFGRSQEAQQAWANGQTSWANQGTPYSNVPPTPNDASANSAQTLGIVGLIISIVCCRIAGLILGIIAVGKAKTSRLALGYEVPEARTGRVCGIIAIVISVVAMAGEILATVLYVIMIGSLVAAFENLDYSYFIHFMSLR